MKNIPNKIITHTSASHKTATAKDISNWHYQRWNGYSPSSLGGKTKYAGYHVVIEWDGKVVQCRAYQDEGIHCRGQNFSSIGVCFVGSGDVHYPSEAQKEAWRALYRGLRAQYGELPVFPHRKYANKSCHGKLLSDTYYTDILGEESPRLTRLKTLLSKLEMMISQVKVLIANERMRG